LLIHSASRYADEAVGDAGWQVMNEVTLHRGRNPHLTVVDAYFDNQHLTEAVVRGHFSILDDIGAVLTV
jgi:hypothetical protein